MPKKKTIEEKIEHRYKKFMKVGRKMLAKAGNTDAAAAEYLEMIASSRAEEKESMKEFRKKWKSLIRKNTK